MMIAVWILVGVIIGWIYLMVKNRRRTPYLKLELDSLPPLEQGIETLAGITEGTVYEGNAVTVLQNGDLFPAMQAAIAAAEHSVHLETFVWTKGTVEKEVVGWLCARAEQGLEVRVLVDALGGSRADSGCFKQLEKCGAQVALYCRPRWVNIRRFNQRTHRKLLVIDGKVGFVFGHGIADQWLGQAQDEKHWRDTAVRVEGPVVRALQSVFMENWIEETRCVPAGPGCFPEPERKGDICAHVFSSASGDAVSSVALVYTVAIASARSEVIIQNPYFAPDDGVCELLGKMVKRGVAVHLMIPGDHTDSPFVRDAGCYLYESLLKAGVRVYEFEPTLAHQKIVIVDGIWSHVGSTNFDSRSLALNEEAGIGLLSREIAQQLRAAFLEDLKRSTEVTLDRWNRRGLHTKVWNWLAYQLHDQL
jgi:cardiolipin synthase A/B